MLVRYVRIRKLAKFNIIPKYCFSCYKVQVNLSNVVDLIKLYFAFDNLNLKNNNTRKCIVETRDKIKGNYKGYLYCEDVSDAETVKKIVEDKKDNLINLFSKRIVEFTIEKEILPIPDVLSKYIKKQNQNKLILEYDKKEININEMIKLLSDNNILFTELKTYDEDLESIFLKLLQV